MCVDVCSTVVCLFIGVNLICIDDRGLFSLLSWRNVCALVVLCVMSILFPFARICDNLIGRFECEVSLFVGTVVEYPPKSQVSVMRHNMQTLVCILPSVTHIVAMSYFYV